MITTGILTTNQEIALLATKDRIASIFSKITLKTRRAMREDDRHIL